jgi:archaellum component FlaC
LARDNTGTVNHHTTHTTKQGGNHMKNTTIWKSNYFFGNEVSDYGKEHHRIDYATLVKSFDAVLNNNIIAATGWEYWEQENGFIDNSEEIEELEEQRENIEETLTEIDNGLTENIDPEEIEELRERLEEIENEIEELETEQEEYPEIFQYFVISDRGAEILEDYTNEIVFYNSELDMYVWGVTHWGTSWDYVLTDIKIELDESRTA